MVVIDAATGRADRAATAPRYDRGMSLVGDRDRERTAAALRRHYVEGRLTEAELDARLDAALRARTRFELVLAGWRLPGQSPLHELVRPLAAAASRTAARAFLLLALATVWASMSVVLLLAFAVTVVVSGAGGGMLLGFVLAWALMTWLVWRAWQRGGVTPR